jgi:hypothetical protein
MDRLHMYIFMLYVIYFWGVGRDILSILLLTLLNYM